MISVLIFLLRTVILFGKSDLTSLLLYVDDMAMASNLRVRYCCLYSPSTQEYCRQKGHPETRD